MSASSHLSPLESSTDTRECHCCHRELSILQFNRDGRGGRRRECRRCRQAVRDMHDSLKQKVIEVDPIVAAYRAWLRSC